jgi:hypothetical protein
MNYEQVNQESSPVRIQEVDVQQPPEQNDQQADDASSESISENADMGEADHYLYAVFAFALLLMLVGFVRARRL